MLNIMLAGVGGQGTVLAAKVLAQAAQHKGWHVRTAETIGMAQRGGSVVSHVRMGNEGEEVLAPLVALGSAHLVIAFEPAEAARVLPYLASDGVIVTATTGIQPVTSALSKDPYRAESVIGHLLNVLEDGGIEGYQFSAEAGEISRVNTAVETQIHNSSTPFVFAGERLVLVDDSALLQQLPNRKVLNTVLLGCAQQTGKLPLTTDELTDALRVCVRPQFVDMNVAALSYVEEISKNIC